jgi:hypothetical protein
MATSVGFNVTADIACMCGVAVGRRRKQQSEEFVLGIGRHRTRRAKPVELDTLGLGQSPSRPFCSATGVELLAHFHQGVQRWCRRS